jgi:hypothetical protein
MSNKINNLKLAVNNSTGAKAAVDPQYEAQALALIDEFQARIDKFDDEFVSQLSVEEQAEIMKWKAGAELWITKLNAFIKTGQWPGGADTFDEFDFYDTLPTLEGNQWHGDYTMASDTNKEEDWNAYNKKFDQLADLTGEFTDVIYVEKAPVDFENGTLGNSAVGFVLDDTVEKIVGKTVGDDIWVSISYRDGKPTRNYCLKNLAVRDDVQLYFYGGQNTMDFIADFSQVIRVANGNNNLALGSLDNGIKVFGGAGNDTIIGSAGKDTLVGGMGMDRIFGMGGWDDINGDSFYLDPGYANSEGDDDYIDGGAGWDTINAGGGQDTLVEDPLHSDEAWGEWEEDPAPREFGNANVDAIINVGNSDYWNISSEIDPETGEITVTKVNNMEGDTIDIWAQDGYMMSSAEYDGSDIVITMVKFDTSVENGKPEYISVRLKGLKQSLNIGEKIKINYHTPQNYQAWDTTITDWSEVNLSDEGIGALTVEFFGYGANDSFVGPKTNFDGLPMEKSELDGGSDLDETELETLLGEEVENSIGETGYNWGLEDQEDLLWGDGSGVNGNNEIELHLEQGSNYDIDFSLPSDFDLDAVFYRTEGNDLVMYMIDVVNDSHKMIKVRFVGNPAAISSLKAEGVKAESLGSVHFSTGNGSDLVVGSKSSSTHDGNEEEGDEIYLEYFNTDFSDETAGAGAVIDTDGDGVVDSMEEQMGSDPNDIDSTPWNLGEEPEEDEEDENPGE